MNNNRRCLLLASLSALVQPSEDEEGRYMQFRSAVISLVTPPPVPMLNVRQRMYYGDANIFDGRDVFRIMAETRYYFYNITGETPETLVGLANIVPWPNSPNRTLSHVNKVLLCLIWIRCYPTFAALRAIFNVSNSATQVLIRNIIPVLYDCLKHYISWPSVAEWNSKRGYWDKIEFAVGAIDGTSYQIYKPMVEPQEQFYSGHRHYHAMHSQIVVDNRGHICHVECGFPGHLNDAQTFNLMPQIGGDVLPFPDECVLLGDKIYPNRHPVMTPLSRQQLNRRCVRDRRKGRKVNRLISQYRVCVEQAIAQIKKYKSIS